LRVCNVNRISVACMSPGYAHRLLLHILQLLQLLLAEKLRSFCVLLPLISAEFRFFFCLTFTLFWPFAQPLRIRVLASRRTNPFSQVSSRPAAAGGTSFARQSAKFHFAYACDTRVPPSVLVTTL